MRICLYTSRALPEFGGQAASVNSLARHFTARGHQVVVLAPSQGSQDPLSLQSLPYRVERHPSFRSSRWFVAWYGRWLARLHARYGFDVIHCHGVYPCGYVAASCPAVAGMPLVVTSYGEDLAPLGPFDEQPQLQSRYRLALQRADAVIAVSEFTRRQLDRTCPGLHCVEQIPNGVDVARFAEPAMRPQSLDPTVKPGYLLFLGRLDWRKGVDALLRAMAKVADNCTSDLVIAGDGPELASLKDQTVRLKLNRRVRFVGRVEEPTKLYLLQNGLCTIVPSRIWEACPVVVLESHAAGRPVIGSRIGGLDELILPEQTGMLVPPDCTIRLAEAIHRVSNDRACAGRWGEEARRVVADYDCVAVADRHLSLFEHLRGAVRGRKAA